MALVALGWFVATGVAMSLNSFWTALGPSSPDAYREPWRVMRAVVSSEPLLAACSGALAASAVLTLAVAVVGPRAHAARALWFAGGLFFAHAAVVLVRVAFHPFAWRWDLLPSDYALLEGAKLVLWVRYQAVVAASAVALTLVALPRLASRFGRGAALRALTAAFVVAVAFGNGLWPSQLQWFPVRTTILVLAVLAETLASRDRARSR